MKKIVSLALVAMMICTLAISTFAAATDVNNNKDAWKNLAHVSYDEQKNFDGTSNVTIAGPDKTADEKKALMDAHTIAADKEGMIFWGWVGAKKEIKGFSYSINGGEAVTDATFTVAAEAAVVNDAKSKGGDFASRYKVKVPLAAGTQMVRVIVDYADGTSETFWACEATRGTATEYTDNGATEIGDGSGSTDDKNPATADVAVVVIATVATVALAGVVVSKKVRV